MPPLSQMLRSESPEGYAAAEKSPINPPPEKKITVGANPYIRTSLPPFNVSPDTLRQFDENGKIPARRVIPLPATATVGGSVTQTTSTTIIQQGSSGGSSSATLSVASVTINVPSLAPGQVYSTSVQMAKQYKLTSMTASQPVEVRLYADKVTQTIDLGRDTDVTVPFQILPGLISDVVFDTTPYLWNWSDRTGCNSDSPQSSSGYVTVINPDPLSVVSASQVVISYLVMET